MSDEQLSAENADGAVMSLQGGQVGHDNIMYNLWLENRKIDASRVEQLSSHAAADYLIGLKADDAAHVIATADVAAATKALKVLLRKDMPLAMTILTQINPSKAQELVEALGPEANWLMQLPIAAEAVADCALANLELGKETGQLSPATESELGTHGYYRSFENGIIHWTETSGAHASHGRIAKTYASWGGSGSPFGFPVTPILSADRSSFGTEGGLIQRFEGNRLYRDELRVRLGAECGAAMYWSEKIGVKAVGGTIGQYHEQSGGSGGPMGFPMDQEAEIGPSNRGTTGHHQRFEGGTAYLGPRTATTFVPRMIAEHHERHDGISGILGFPVSPDYSAAESAIGTTGRFQRFEGKFDYGSDICATWEFPGGATIYASEDYGVHCVGWGNGECYERLGGTCGWLGFPLSDEVDARESESEPWCSTQEFEGGTIFYKEAYGSIPVPLATGAFILDQPGLRKRLGFPVKPEEIIDADKDYREQLFEHGMVTVREGIQAAWLSYDG